ncbi:MAG TPA: ABC transporter ATP-binding protein [Firmicutes bacterium]|nr:ABC transporter ATP-binding protein [Bacillota bacterium]
MNDCIIKTINLTKIYKIKGFLKTEKVVALDRLNLDIRKGSIFGFLGPNGAGKTTAIKILLGLLLPTAGDVFVLGKDPRDTRAKSKIGFLPEMTYYESYLKIDEILKYYAGLFQMDTETTRKRIDYVLDLVGLTGFRKKFLHEYSKGMLQRLGLAQALLNDPELLILDEPTSGLDPIAQMEIRQILSHLAEEGKTIFLSSHLLSEVELICSHTGILKAGKLVKWGALNDLLKINRFFEIHLLPSETFNERIIDLDLSQIPVEDKLIISTENEEVKDKIIKIAADTNSRIIGVYPRKDSLEIMFKKLMLENQDVYSD